MTRPNYNEANLLEGIEAKLHGSGTTTTFVKNIDYDAKGQRTLIEYGSGATPDRQGVITTFSYDPLTFRLIHLLTQRNARNFPGDCPEPRSDEWPGCQIQNLHYTYDPVGNITHIRDDAQQTIFFRNQRVDPSAEYTYDAIYRLIEATGREHLGQAADGSALPPTPTSDTDAPRVGLLHPHDRNAMGRYIQRYIYDEVGNFLKMNHCGTGPVHPTQPCWTRTYDYNETSLIEDGTNDTSRKVSNRLSSTTIRGDTVTYGYVGNAGLHGNMTAMPHLPLMEWDFMDQLQASSKQVNNDGIPETTYYVYDAAGQRVRKVTELQASAGATPRKKNERIYLGGFEIYREYIGNREEPDMERETLHVMDDKQRVALVETKTIENEVAINVADLDEVIRFQLNNHLGSSSIELDENAGVISYEEFYPYGSTSFQAVRNGWEGSVKRYRYTGMERDDESGLNYHSARYYAGWLGRWCSCDPIGIGAGVNLFRYARNNPVILNDPRGMNPPDIRFGGFDLDISGVTSPNELFDESEQEESNEHIRSAVDDVSPDQSPESEQEDSSSFPDINLEFDIPLGNWGNIHFDTSSSQLRIGSEESPRLTINYSYGDAVQVLTPIYEVFQVGVEYTPGDDFLVAEFSYNPSENLRLSLNASSSLNEFGISTQIGNIPIFNVLSFSVSGNISEETFSASATLGPTIEFLNQDQRRQIQTGGKELTSLASLASLDPVAVVETIIEATESDEDSERSTIDEISDTYSTLNTIYKLSETESSGLPFSFTLSLDRERDPYLLLLLTFRY